MVGGWFGRASQDGSFSRFSPVFATTGNENPNNAAVLNDPAVFTRVCGGLSTGGTLDQTANQFGGFAGYGSARGFVDGTFAWTRRDHAYARNVCTIETQGVVKYNSTTGVLSDDAHAVVDDIYAGTLSGVSKIDETSFSVRGGTDAGNARVSGGPRAIFTVTRATTGAYIETGKNTVANTVTFNNGDKITRTLGGPIGTELAFDEQTRTSVLLEAGGEFAVHAGSVSPFFAAYWRHEFNGDFPIVTARMAQDRRTTPTVLSFGFDAYDRDAFQFGFGANAVSGERFMRSRRVHQARVGFDLQRRDVLDTGPREVLTRCGTARSSATRARTGPSANDFNGPSSTTGFPNRCAAPTAAAASSRSG